MYKVIVDDITDGREQTVWIYDTIQTASQFITDLHKNYQNYLHLVQGKDYEIELIEL